MTNSDNIHHSRRLYGNLKFFPAKTALLPSYSSILINWLYLANLSDLHGAPVLIWPVPSPTTKSAMKLSSVYPDLWETITPHFWARLLFAASMDSVKLPIWLTLSKRALHAFFWIASSILKILVTKRSSPTICSLDPKPFVMLVHPSQSSWSNGSYIDVIGYLLAYFSYN